MQNNYEKAHIGIGLERTGSEHKFLIWNGLRVRG